MKRMRAKKRRRERGGVVVMGPGERKGRLLKPDWFLSRDSRAVHSDRIWKRGFKGYILKSD